MVSKSEQLILVDEQDNQIGITEKLSAHQNNQLHRAFSVFIFRQKKDKYELLIQQRAWSKYHSPGLWTNTCCSHPRPNENVIAAGERRLLEEFGIHTCLRKVGSFHYQADFPNGLFENEIDHVLIANVAPDVIITPNPNEIHAYRWMDINELDQTISNHPEQFTPWLKKALGIALTSLYAS